ncbi:mitochondrial ubiquitin ligase activator of NFKB 1-like [Denticeps clupeoides]|uniref:RING-type E3 ubiquitin transferase n=1 Tax=Denticeps clupeoides TaxID=299321 RepID=A0A8C4CCD9_9TELE|nr:mitochondrial ubiquitin ligase activator of NFKB 1-like [Denticeps clupeoides]XP_028850431.1 mitochondrial ubiquitin ligase activator of NFKB 1-like [Denticeps clupeoides]
MDPDGKASVAQLLLLGTSSALTALLFSVYRRRSAAAAALQEATKVSISQDLRGLLSESPGKCVPYAVIEGVVRSAKEPLSSQFVDNCKGVMERLTLREKTMVWNRTTHLWNDCEKIIHQRTNTVPFDLASHDDGVATTVRVVRPLDAAELDLETTYEKFHPAVRSLTNAIGHFLSGERPRGVQETEEMLRVGDSVTAVGELVLDRDAVQLRPPKQDLRYFLSRRSYDALLAKQRRGARAWGLLALACGLAACGALAYVLWRRGRDRRALARLGGDACAVCLSRRRACVFLHCGHVCSCEECYRALPQPKRCPICRAAVDRVVALYNS